MPESHPETPPNRRTGRLEAREECERLVHELRVHQVELEMQNEELRATRKEVDAALEQYAEFYDFAPVGFLTLDRAGVVLAANATASTLLGLARITLIGRQFTDFLKHRWRKVVEGALMRVFREPGRQTIMAELVQGAPVRFVRVEAGMSCSGEECRAVLVDVTDQRRVEEDLSRLNADLERRVEERTAELRWALKEQESFSYSVSHDLRAPLRHINSYTAILKEEYCPELPSGAVDYLDRICDVSRHMGELIDNLLALSHIGRSELVLQRIDLSAQAAAVAEMVRTLRPEPEVELFIEPEITVTGDKTLIWLVLENLLGNAWKFAAKRDRPRVEVRRQVVEGRTAYLVRDNGVGFDMAYRSQLFRVFQRLHGSEFEGVGIGLATVKRIIERHGGEVWAEAREDEGATFYFTLGE